MIFVFGGAFSGKSEYVKKEFGIEAEDGAEVSCEELEKAAAVKNFHLFLRKLTESGGDACSEIDSLLCKNPDIIIISNEIGCGVVPIDKPDREYREAVGRACCYLADKAERMIRVVCGIGQVIK